MHVQTLWVIHIHRPSIEPDSRAIQLLLRSPILPCIARIIVSRQIPSLPLAVQPTGIVVTPDFVREIGPPALVALDFPLDLEARVAA